MGTLGLKPRTGLEVIAEIDNWQENLQEPPFINLTSICVVIATDEFYNANFSEAVSIFQEGSSQSKRSQLTQFFFAGKMKREILAAAPNSHSVAFLSAGSNIFETLKQALKNLGVIKR